ncbi:MAG: response regulator [Roseibacillus sp.]|jgi:DNA-binding NtrC family response regulator|nr:response regulator [Roseibacillus sp.]MDP7306740.1 sigma-54 dependent transcriptional regulator [Roseibacillus sp.]HJM65028.1 sigma-54 dependent transcriptional regulator [Roseibacillus sp.]|tara:strand:- start:5372 stop:6757 length:1386 start_codon:yes stop_codon:yes gene_type:complete
MATATKEQTILLVDEDLDFLDWATKHLVAKGVQILRCDNSENAVKIADKTDLDLVISDIQVQPFDGLELLSRIRAKNSNAVVVLTAGFPTTSQIIEATRRGARDVLRKESLPFELRPVVEAALQNSEQRRQAEDSVPSLPAADGPVKMIGISRPLQEVFKIVGRVSQTDAPVLITGESGTGKELVARAVHEYNPRRQGDMVAINCGAIPENLLESELFGHEKGAFTGAVARRTGRFEQCDGGTLFLDEIGDMPASVQVKLLRILQEGTFSRVGSNEIISSDVRIVAATNKDLAVEVSQGNFREDLYYRLNVVEIDLPPLRNRPEDIPLLAEFFLQRLARKQGMARMRLSGEAVETLQKHRWPGNVRELENTIARACALSTSDLLLPEDIPFARSPFSHNEKLSSAFELLLSLVPQPEEGLLEWFRAEFCRRVFEQSDSDLKECARRLGITQPELRDILGTE